MKKFCILSCGGTLIMKRNNKGILSPYYDGDRLLTKVPELKTIVDFEVENITNIDSTNMSVKIWATLARKIFTYRKKYDGFIIIHGTDTMAYTASALTYALRNIDKPIIFTGAQKPLDDINSDGRNNLINSCLVAQMELAEVCIVFGSKILKGNRSTKVSESSLDAFDSPMVEPLGEISLEPKLKNQINRKNSKKQVMCQSDFNSEVIIITLQPSLPVTYLRKILDTGCKGIILKAFGAGNIPDDIIPFLKEAKSSDIPVVILSQCNKGMTQMQLYQVGYQVLEAGGIAGRDMTLEAAVTKLMWGLANIKNFSELRKLFDKNLAGEVTLSN